MHIIGFDSDLSEFFKYENWNNFLWWSDEDERPHSLSEEV